MVYAGRPLDATKDDSTLADIGLQNNSTVTMVGRLKGGSLIEIKVELANNEEIKINVDSNLTVIELKEKIKSENSCLHVSQMHLSYAGIDLKDDKLILKDLIKDSSVAITLIQSK